jgi:hypothetical protein
VTGSKAHGSERGYWSGTGRFCFPRRACLVVARLWQLLLCPIPRHSCVHSRAEYESVQRLIRMDPTMMEMDSALWLVGELALAGHPNAIKAAATYLHQTNSSFAA